MGESIISAENHYSESPLFILQRFFEKLPDEDNQALMKLLLFMRDGHLLETGYEKIFQLIQTELSLHKARVVNIYSENTPRRLPILTKQELLVVKKYLELSVYPQVIKNKVGANLSLNKTFENESIQVFSPPSGHIYIYYNNTQEVAVFSMCSYAREQNIFIASYPDISQGDMILNHQGKPLLDTNKKYRFSIQAKNALLHGFLQITEIGKATVLISMKDWSQVTGENYFSDFDFTLFEEIGILAFSYESEQKEVCLLDKKGQKISENFEVESFFDDFPKGLGLRLGMFAGEKVFHILNIEASSLGVKMDQFSYIMNYGLHHDKEKIIEYMKNKFFTQ